MVQKSTIQIRKKEKQNLPKDIGPCNAKWPVRLKGLVLKNLSRQKILKDLSFEKTPILTPAEAPLFTITYESKKVYIFKRSIVSPYQGKLYS